MIRASFSNFTEIVNGKTTVGAVSCERSYYRAMGDLPEIVRRIEQRLEAVGLNPTSASRAAGLSDGAIRNLQRAVRGEIKSTGVNAQTITKLAPVLRTTPAWLLDESGSDDDIPRPARKVPIVGHVSAGSTAYFLPAGQLGETDPVDGSTEATVAVEVRGDSMGTMLNGALVFYDDVRRPVTRDLEGRLCVVGLADGRIVVKRLQKARGGRYHLLSEGDPILDAEVEWAAKVKNIRPR